MKSLVLFFISIVAFGQQYPKVDFIKCDALLYPNENEKSISGTIDYTFKVNQVIDSIKIDAQNMQFNSILLNNKIVDYKVNKTHLVLYKGYKKGFNTLSFSYKATPKQTLYFIGKGNDLQIWTQGQGKYTSHWLPSFDDVNEKLIFNLSIVNEFDFENTIEKNKTVLSNGTLKSVSSTRSWSRGIDTFTWNYYMTKPMSSYLVMLAIGNFSSKKEISKSGVPLEFYLDNNDEQKFEPTYRYSKQLFDFFEKEIGVKYPWKIYKQVPVRDFLYAGMENTTATLFSQDFVVDSIGFNDRNYVNINAHELAHQWFGDIVTAKSSKHHWLHEGFATYYALLAEKEVFGDDYFYHQLYKTALQLKAASKTDTIPILNEKASSLTFYQKGAWALHYLRENIGAEKFNKIVKKYLNKYKFKSVETDDFLNYVEKYSDFNTQNFKTIWLESGGFEYQTAIELLKRNNMMHQLLQLKNEPITDKNIIRYESDFKKIMISNSYYLLKQEVISKILPIEFNAKTELIELALNSNDYKVRQTIAFQINDVPAHFKEKYEKLLFDNSYETRESAFINLMKSFPENENKYLKIASSWIGNNDKALRMLYLYYNIKSISTLESEKEENRNELINYSSSTYESSIRQNAFDYLLYLKINDKEVYKNLIQATTHFKWQFNKYAKDKIKLLVKNQYNKQIFEEILFNLPEREQTILKNILKE
jgi:aminopeptidase N